MFWLASDADFSELALTKPPLWTDSIFCQASGQSLHLKRLLLISSRHLDLDAPHEANKKMNDGKPAWQRTLAAFAGNGIHWPSDMMRVTESDASTILEKITVEDWLAPAYVGTGRHAGYTVCDATKTSCTALFYVSAIVGFYAGSYLWISREHRSSGLSIPLILAAANQRGGTVLPAGVPLQGYTSAGASAHRSAHSRAVLIALAKGLPVPAEVVEGMPLDAPRLSTNACFFHLPAQEMAGLHHCCQNGDCLATEIG